MPPRARIITSPVAEDITPLGDGRVRMRVYGAGRGARDLRVAADEQRLTVVAGRMAVSCNGTLSVLEAGQAIAVAPGVEHAWWSTRVGELCLEIASGP